MGSLDRRIEALEAQFAGDAPEDPAAEFRRRMRFAILDEYGKLKASRAVGYRGGKRVEPENIPLRELGPGHTQGDVMGLAVRRVVERELAADLAPGEAEGLIEGCTEGMRRLYERMGKGDAWDEVEDASYSGLR